MINQKNKIILSALALVFALFLLTAFASAQVFVSDVDQETIYPGQDANIDITVTNDFNHDIEDVSVNIVFANQNGQILFTPVGSSSDSIDEINNEDKETFSFRVKAANSISPGDYVLGYVITYNNLTTPIQGTIGVTVGSRNALDFSVSQSTMVQGMNDKATLTIYNKGDAGVKFVIVNADVAGATLLSENKVYIGSISSDDFETASFNVLLNNANPSISFTITYRDFENNPRTETLNYDLTAYSRERAIELGLVKTSKAPYIFGVIIVVAIIFFIIRAIRKARAKKEKLKRNGMA
jgi:hypothetical protein